MNNHPAKYDSFLLFFCMIFILTEFDFGAQTIINVPSDYSTVMAALSAVADGDTILVAPGTYQENIEIPNKSIVLASWFLTTQDTNYISQTILDGNGGISVINIPGSVVFSPSIIGFTIQNASDGISPHAKFNITNCRVTDCSDGIDYESGSGGLCNFNVFENNSDDGIDLDGDVDIIIEDNIIRNNDDDGIEVRLPSYTGPLLTCIIRRNLIYGNHEDGIQLIDYNSASDRFFLIERNLLFNNDMVGLGCMGNSNTTENYEGASIPERIYLFNNTFGGNNYGVTGGDSLIGVNNIFVDHPGIAMKNVDGGSSVSYGMYWNNGSDFENCNVDNPSVITSDPLFYGQYLLRSASPAIDAGTALYFWQGDTVLNLPSSAFTGIAPDLGALEFSTTLGLVVISPNGGEIWQGGSIQNITWSSAGTSGNVRIEYSADNGLNWSDVFTSALDDGIEPWLVPDISTSQALLCISDTDGDGPSDTSDALMTIFPSQTIRFANIGDYGDAGQDEQDVSELISSWNVSFVITNGDNNYPDGDILTIDDNIGQYYREYIDNYLGSYPGNNPAINDFFPSLGNHDWRTRTGDPEVPYPYLDYFTLPGAGISTTGTSGNERYYDFIIGPVHFFALDSDPYEPDGRTSVSIQGQWLQTRLATSTSKWKVVFMHHAPYSSSSNHGSETDMQWPFEDWGADVVFAGHDHTYERIVKDDNNDGVAMPYFVNGLGGRSMYSFGTPIPGSQVRYADDYGAMLIAADTDSMTFQFYTRTDQLIDTYKIPGGPALTVTSPNGGETWQGGSTQNITWSSFATSGTVRIEYSTDNGLNWSDIASSTSDDGIESWSVSDNPTTQALIRVSDVHGDGPSDQSDDVFNIIPTSVSVMSFQDGVDGFSGTMDTKLLGAHLTTNYGDALTLELDGGSEVKKESTLLLWDLTGISLGNTVYSVDIVLDFSNASSESYEVYKMKRAWVEDKATWNEYASGFSWEIPGADGTGDRDSTVLGTIIPSPPAGLSTISLNAAGVAVVQSWIDNPASNYGFIMMDYANSDGATFSSREAATVTEHPMLTVTYSPTPTVLVEAKIFLEGPYISGAGEMSTSLITSGYIPMESPYLDDQRAASAIPPDITDWVLVELRETDTGPVVFSKSAFLRKDGRIVGDDGTTEQITADVSAGDYYIVIRHRNHLAVMSANPVSLNSSSSTLYDFTTGTSQYYGSDAKLLEASVFGMYKGDANGNSFVNSADYLKVKGEIGSNGYYEGDCNLNSFVNSADYLNVKPNVGKSSQVP